MNENTKKWLKKPIENFLGIWYDWLPKYIFFGKDHKVRNITIIILLIIVVIFVLLFGKNFLTAGMFLFWGICLIMAVYYYSLKRKK